jgi:hypothetical protein
MAKIYNMEMQDRHDALTRGFEVDKNGAILRSWTFVKHGNGGLVNDESAARPHIGRNISEYPAAYKIDTSREP